MLQIKILQENQSYTFSSYFDLPYETDDILREFDYSFIKTELYLPRTDKSIDELLIKLWSVLIISLIFIFIFI